MLNLFQHLLPVIPDLIRDLFNISLQLHRSLAIRGSAATAHLRWALGKGPPRRAVAVHQHPTTNIVIPDTIRNLHPTFFFHPPESHTANASIQHHRPGLSIALDSTTDISRHPGPDPASLNPRSTYQTVGNSNSLIINQRILLRKKKVLFPPTTLHQIAGLAHNDAPVVMLNNVIPDLIRDLFSIPFPSFRIRSGASCTYQIFPISLPSESLVIPRKKHFHRLTKLLPDIAFYGISRHTVALLLTKNLPSPPQKRPWTPSSAFYLVSSTRRSISRIDCEVGRGERI